MSNTMKNTIHCLLLIATLIVAVGAQAVTRYVKPDTGSDSNDGSTSELAWATFAKLTAELDADAAGTIDTVIIDTSGGAVRMDSPIVIPSTVPSGFLLRSQTVGTKADLLAFQLIDSGDWTKTAGRTNIYQATIDAGANVWEDRKWVAHLNTNTYTDLAGILTQMDATPGSFYVDSTTAYIHPFGSTNPASDGKTYEYSPDWSGIGGTFNESPAIAIESAADITIQDLKIGGTCRRNPANSTSNGGYDSSVIKGDARGSSTLQRLELYYGGVHCISDIAGTDNTTIDYIDITAYQVNPSGGSVFVNYANTGNDGNIRRWTRCSVPNVKGVVGSTAGTPEVKDNFAYESHGAGKFALLQHTFGDYRGDFKTTVGDSDATVITDTRLTGFSTSYVGTDSLTVRRCHMTLGYGGVESGRASATTEFTDNLLEWTDDTYQGAFYGASLVFLRNTSICHHATPSSSFGRAHLWLRTATMDVEIKNNVFAFVNTDSGATPMAPYKDLGDSMTLDIDNNAYILVGSTPTMVVDYDDGSPADMSWTEWLAEGHDAHSIMRQNNYTALRLNAGYFPAPNSPLINTGRNYPMAVDKSRTAHAYRNDIGCYEFDERLADRVTYYTKLAQRTDLVSWWRLGDTASPFIDIIGGHSATTTSTVTPYQPGLVIGDTNGSALFGGGYITTADTVINPNSGNFWYSVVFRPTTISADHNILAQLDGTGTGRSWLYCVSNGTLRTTLGGSTVNLGAVVAVNTTYHFVFSMSGTTWTAYLNGAQIGTGTLTPTSATGGVRIGSWKGGTSTFLGPIDEVVIGEGSISSADVAELASLALGLGL